VWVRVNERWTEQGRARGKEMSKRGREGERDGKREKKEMCAFARENDAESEISRCKKSERKKG